jgi:serine/threonine-protein kinase HipA
MQTPPSRRAHPLLDTAIRPARAVNTTARPITGRHGAPPPENPGAHSYEQYLQTCLRLDLAANERRHAFRQVVFNVAAAVCDDHTKNFAFLYDHGEWVLAPAFDLTFPFLDGGGWLTRHQLTIGGSVDGASRDTLRELAERSKVVDPDGIIDTVVAAVKRWPTHAERAGVLSDQTATVTYELEQTALTT